MENIIKKNILYNTFNTVVNMIVPIIIMMYITRIFTEEYFGIYNLIVSFTNVFLIIGNFGLQFYGVREIAISKPDSRKKIANDLFLISILISFITYLMFVFTIHIIPSIENEYLYYLYGIIILLQPFSVLWYIQGVEKLKTYSILNAFLRILSIFFILYYVNSNNDIKLFIIINLGVNLISSLVNFILFIRDNRLNFKKIKVLNHLKKMYIIFLMTVFGAIYLQLDTVMLGYLTNEVEVAYYSVAVKIKTMVTALLISIGSMYTPRIALSFKSNTDQNKTKTMLINDSLATMFLIALPATFGYIILADKLIPLLAGPNYYQSIYGSKVIMLVIPIITMCFFWGKQVLIPLDKEKLVLSSTIVGAISNMILNFIMIQKYQHLGAIYATLITEIIVLVIVFKVGLRNVKIKIDWFNMLKQFIGATAMFVILYLLSNSLLNILDNIILIIIDLLVGILSYYLILTLLKEKKVNDINIKMLGMIKYEK